MAELIRGFDWSATPLGPLASWQPPLRTAVSLMLAARHPVFLFWSTELRCLYNDAARPLLGPEKHPWALGARAGDAWNLLDDEVRCVLAGGPAGWQEDRLLPMFCDGGLEDAWWTCSCSAVADEAAPSGVGGVLALCTETTLAVLARHESDRRLSESEARFREIADAAPVMIWVADEAQACTWFNAPWLSFTGRTLEQALGAGWAESIHPDDIGRWLETYAEAFASRRPFRMDFRLRRHDGQWRVVDNTGAPRLGDDGVLLGFIGCCIDVTRQRETEARFRGVFNADLMGMTVFDANTGATLAINDRFLRMTGHARADFDEGRWSRADFNPPKNDPRDAEAIAQARAGLVGPVRENDAAAGRELLSGPGLVGAVAGSARPGRDRDPGHHCRAGG